MSNELHKIGVKFFTDDSDDVDLLDLIPVFHRWIQDKLCDTLLIDVADYSHVQDGPGILLVAHEGNYSFDETGGRRGLVFYSKRNLEGSLAERIAKVCRLALEACLLLEQAPELDGRIRFSGAGLEVFANDRLAAPNTEQTMERVEASLNECLGRLYPAGVSSVSRNPDPRERFSLSVHGGQPATAGELRDRLV